jgi:hypothetical protein
MAAQMRLTVGLGLALVGGAGAAPRPYVDAAACARAGVYAPAQCERGFREARIAFDGAAPHFATRGLCEQRYARCMIGHVFAHGGVDFTPAMRGFVFAAGRGAPITETALPQAAAPPRVASPEAETPGAAAPSAYPVPKAALEDLRARERRYGGE